MLTNPQGSIRHSLERFLYRFKPPLHRQIDEADCGPAALLSVLRYYGGRTTLVRARELCRTDPNGTHFLDMIRAAGALGFNARGVTGEYSDLISERKPCIAHIVLRDGRQHFVVLYRADRRRVVLGDPADGVRSLAAGQFLHLWREKAVIVLSPTANLRREPAEGWFRWIWDYVRKSGSWLGGSLFWGAFNAALGLVIAIYMQRLIDVLIPKRDPRLIVLSGLFLLVLMTGRALTGYFSARFIINLIRDFSHDMGHDLFSRLFRLPLLFFRTQRIGELIDRLIGNSRIQGTLLMFAHAAVGDFLILIAASVLLIIIVPQFTLFLVLLLPGTLVALWGRIPGLRRQQARLIYDQAIFHAYLIDVFSGIETILGFGVEDNYSRICKQLQSDLIHAQARLGVRGAGVSLSLKLCSAVHTVVLLSYGALSVCTDRISLGQMMAGFYLISTVLNAVGRSIRILITLQGAPVAVERLRDIFHAGIGGHAGKEPFQMNERLALLDGGFSWPKSPPFLYGINMVIKRGELTALWGPCGSGKSTLARILQQIYPLEVGRIEVDGLPASRIDPYAYRRNVALLPQHIKIFNGTVADNILAGRPFISLKQLQRRARELGFAAPFHRLRRGFLTPIGENGQSLSAGEKVVLALLRTLYDEPAVAIFDECFGTLDGAWQSLVYAVVRDYSRRHAVLLITHHLEWIARCDRVYQLRSGTLCAADETCASMPDRGVGR